MRWLATLAVVVVSALMSPTAASGYTFGDWASDNGYSPGDVMPERGGRQRFLAIDSLDGIGEFDWTTTPTTELYLDDNQISSIESGDFSGLTNLTRLDLDSNQISSIESGDFSGLTNLTALNLCRQPAIEHRIGRLQRTDESDDTLDLYDNQISSIESGAFSGLTNLTTLYLDSNQISSIESGDFSGLTNLTSAESGRQPAIEHRIGRLQRTDESDDAESGRQPDIEHRIGRLQRTDESDERWIWTTTSYRASNRATSAD